MKKITFFNFIKGILFASLWIISLNMYTQNITVKGSVKDSKGEPLIGVTILIKGTTTGTVTDADGNFTLNNVPNNATLEISYVGMKTQSIPVNGRTTINVIMEEETSYLDEVVVVGYGTMKQRDLTGAIATIKTEELLAETPRSVQDLLRANVAGLNVGFAASAKGSTGFEIRGKNTLKAGSEPLIVIDGVIYEGDLTD
ncbi:MAG: carboxypeptidase-like regulatory domain-containing protein, partial [Dysgonamonadaceae bacterium]